MDGWMDGWIDRKQPPLLCAATGLSGEEEEEEEEGRVRGGMRDTVERVRMRTLAHLQRWAHRHI